ncbi:MAG TPA: carboxypeptidase-like regulatory domain-containing protein [Terriglobia bacterium]|nr:carboxypeptidase-like regulatory domain-containing protein [Terriglobia bacterium]
MRRDHRVLAALFVLLGLVWSVPGWTQQSKGSFTGTVTDASGGVVPGAKVTAVEQGTGFTASAFTSRDGAYTIPLLPPGSYLVTAEKAGFSRSTLGPIPLTVDQHPKLDIELKVGSTATTVNVEAAAPVLDTQSASVGTTIELQKVTQLPLNGRNFLQLTLFTPGVVPGTSGSENSTRGGAINVNGLRESMNSFWLDGLNDTSVAVGTYAVTPPIDSVQEFRMETGLYDARFGTNAGAQVNVVTKSGTDQLHGSAYEYLRNSALDTRNFFDPTVPPFRRNQFGATVGGPIFVPGVYDGHDKSFFFFAYEGLRERRSIFQQGRVPTLAERSGNFLDDLVNPSCPTKTLLLDPLVLLNPAAPLTVPGNNLASILPPSGPDPVGAAFVDLYPLPNIAGAACGAANRVDEGNRQVDTDSYATRLDHRWGAKDTFFGRFNLTSDREFRPFNDDSSLLGYGINVHNVNVQTGVDWTHIFSSTIINEFKAGYNRWNETLNNQDEGNTFATTSPVNLAGVPVSGKLAGVPRITFSGYADLGSQTNNPQGGAVNTFEFADTVTHIHGSHALAYGFDIRPIKRGNFTRNRTIRGEYDFSGVTTGALVLGALQQSLPPAQFQQVAAQLFQACPPSSCSFGNPVADALLGIPQDWINGFTVPISGTGTEYDYFFTDNWKAEPDLTLDFGVRYEYNSLVTDKNNHFANFDFSSTACGGAQGAILVAGTSSATVDCPQLNAFGTLSFVPVSMKNFGSTAENRALQFPDRDNFAPRFGFAWQPFHSSSTVLRGGYGVFFDQTFGDVYFQRAANPPFVQVNVGQINKALPSLIPAIQSGQLPLASGALINNAFVLAAAPVFPAISPFQTDFQDSFIQEWSLDVQRQLPGSWLFDVGYVGTRGLRLPRGTDPNQFTGNLAACTPTAGCPHPFPAFPQDFVYTTSSGSSIYHALQVKAERHFTGGFAFLASYTYGHSIDTNSTFGSTDVNANAPQNSLDLAAEKAASDFDIRHRLSVSYVYDLPFGGRALRASSPAVNYAIQGWELAGIVTVQSGSPFTPVISGDVSCTGEFQNFGALTDRPNLVGNPYPAKQTPNQWVLPSAFSNPAAAAGVPCAFGNAGRNILRGPGLSDWDFSLVRNFRITESKSLEFRAEMFNLLNHANFATPERDTATSSFGQIFNTVQPLAGIASGGPGDPREIQFALRFVW